MGNGQGLRYNSGKIRLSLVPTDAVQGIGSVLTYGAIKYTYTVWKDKNGKVIKTEKGESKEEFENLTREVISGANNWRLGMSWSNVLDSLERHLLAFKEGEDFDQESGEYHIDHLLTNAAFLKTYYRIYPQGDDRLHSYKNKPIIGCDIDGVLADFSSTFIKHVEKAGINVTKHAEWKLNQPHWDFPYEWNEVWEKVKRDKNFWLDIPAIINGKDLPFEPDYYITSRSIPSSWSEEWLSMNNFPCRQVISTNGGSKVPAIKELNINIFIDDSIDNFVDISKNSNACCYLLDQSYNRKYDVGFKRIKNLKEIRF